MGNKAQGVQETRNRVAAHYQVTDLVVRRDWYSVASVFAAGEVSESEWQGIANLLANVSLDELALLDAQLQLAGVSQPKAAKDLTKANEQIVVASALELSRRRQYLQNQAACSDSFGAKYRRSLEKDLRRAISYSYSAENVAMMVRTTHQLLDAIKQAVIARDELADALMVILRRDPMLISGLVDDGFVSLRDAGQALDRTPIAPIDAIRLLVALPELATKDRLGLFVDRIDLGAIAQLRDEVPHGMVRDALNARAAVLLSKVLENEERSSSRYGALYGSEYAYAEVRYRQLHTVIKQLDDTILTELHEWIGDASTVKDIQAVKTVPMLRGHDVAEVLQFLMMLGVRFEWASKYGDHLYAEYGQKWLTQPQRILLLNDEVGHADSDDYSGFDRINTRLWQLAMQFTVTARELLRYAPSLQGYRSKLSSNRELRSGDMVVLACLSSDDAELRTDIVRRLDEEAFCELLDGSIDGLSLAKAFLRSLDNANMVYLMLRWGSRARNGYLLRIAADVSMKRYSELYRDVESRGLDVMTLSEMDEVLGVLAETREVTGSVSSEQSIGFIDQLVKTYGAEQAGRFVRAAGIRHAKELSRFSPFYVKLLIDMYDEDLLADRLQGLEETLTYEQAQEIRGKHYKEKQSFASEVVASLQRSLKAQVSAPQQIVTEVV